MKSQKAYEVYDGGDNWTIVFATNSAAARREGANEIGCDWSEVDHCRRKPSLDQYAPGPAPAQALIDIGWGFECGHCWSWVGNESGYVTDGHQAYCNATCHALDCAHQRRNLAAQAAMCELVYAWLPDVQITDVYVYGAKLKPQALGQGYNAYADFRFAGSIYPARWVFGEDAPRVHGDDLLEFQRQHPAFNYQIQGKFPHEHYQHS